MASEELTRRWLELRKEFNLPAYEWAYLSGYMDCRRDRWYFDKLTFLYTLSDGRLVKFDPAMAEWEKKEITDLGISGHYWSHNMRPYFVGSNATDRKLAP
jgi:hypothetical protein